MRPVSSEAAIDLARRLRETLDAMPPGAPIRPGHRIKFHWPPYPVSRDFHVTGSDWTGTASFEAYGEPFEVTVAETAHGVFVRCDDLWHEARGADLAEAIQNLKQAAEPLFARQFAAARALGLTTRFNGHIRDLPPLDVLRLLFCEDRDVAHDAMTEIETHASTGDFFPALLVVLDEKRHAMRRSAQWCVLDLFESLPSFASLPEAQALAVEAIQRLLWTAEDDDCRAIYKAGVVLGGHVPGSRGGDALLACLGAPSRIGRRAAMHGLFHVVEWSPERRDEVVEAFKRAAESEPEPVLRRYAEDMARDIALGNDHVPDPVFAD